MDNSTKPWSILEKILFRFFAFFFLIYIVGGFISFVFRIITPWFAANVLKLEKPITIFTNGSGDTTYDYLTVSIYLLIAVLGSSIWSVIDRKRADYDRLLYFTSVIIRYFLAMNMLLYGFAKVFHLQMSFPSLSELIQPLGEKSPMGLAWTYVGFSKEYSFFTGFVEVLAGILLLFRRTIPLGSILTAIVTINILAINLFFDVPVKLFSAILFLMSLFLIAPDLKRLINFFVLNIPAEPKKHLVYLKNRWLRMGALAIKCLFIGYLLYGGIVNQGIHGQKSYGDKMVKPPLYGLYETEYFIHNNDTIPPLITDKSRWRNLVIQWENNAMIKMMNDSVSYYSFVVDTLSNNISFYQYNDTANKNTLNYEKKGEYLTITGLIKSDSVKIHLKERDRNSFRLMNRGFRWINEYPYNR